ncbi:hepatitis A virus cellular receptor 2 homolog isoform X6 [Paramormyrops kingsleyae]|uniref:hepatitis A virus cellular receptor 2 homolog isoform X5 n=1 Tax=Paramormyrops kingsleyae TaxID=1676925 RepID=UPI003B973CF3
MAVHGHCMPALLLILFHIMPVAESSQTITGFVAYNVTLPCSYDAEYYGGLHVCWGRGELPLTGGCGNEIIVTDGLKVTRRTSPRYQLIGDLNQGDVSLTIISAEMGDSGIYGCRVQIPGLFNDLKHQVTLTIQNIHNTTASPSSTASPETQTVISVTQGYYGNYSTGSSTANTPQGSDHADRSFLIIAVVILLLLLLVLVTGLWLYKRQRQREARTLAAVENQTDVSVHYGNVGAHTGFHPRGMVIENVYELRDFGDYEFCP